MQTKQIHPKSETGSRHRSTCPHPNLCRGNAAVRRYCCYRTRARLPPAPVSARCRSGYAGRHGCGDRRPVHTPRGTGTPNPNGGCGGFPGCQRVRCGCRSEPQDTGSPCRAVAIVGTRSARSDKSAGLPRNRALPWPARQEARGSPPRPSSWYTPTRPW